MTKTLWTITIASILVAGLVAPAFTNNAFAVATYTVNSNELGGEVIVNPIQLGTDVSSFYSYNSPDGASANTGLEQSNTAVLFLGEDNNGDVSLFVIYDEAGDGTGGRVLTSITSNGLAGQGVIFLVKDDPGELANWDDNTGSGNTNHRWVACCTDGFVLGTLPTTDFDVFPGFDVRSGINNFVFLTQGETNIEQVSVSTDSTPEGLVISLRTTTDVEIDIKPGSYPSSVSCKNDKGVVPVAVFGSDGFDVSTINVDTLELNGMPVVEAHDTVHVEDVNGDGFDDAVLHLEKAGVCDATEDYPLKQESTAILSGDSSTGPFEGTGDIRIVN